MDDLLLAALNAAALRPDGDTHCHKHPERPATSQLYGIPKCRECVAADHAVYQRAFGTGTGPEAHAEANGSYDSIHHNDRHYAQAFPRCEYTVLRGGKPK